MKIERFVEYGSAILPNETIYSDGTG
jgi:hypothetical protein